MSFDKKAATAFCAAWVGIAVEFHLWGGVVSGGIVVAIFFVDAFCEAIKEKR